MCLSGQSALEYNYSSTMFWYTNFHSTGYFHFQNSLQCISVFLRCKGTSITYQFLDIVTWQNRHCGFRLDWPHLPSNANGNNLYNCSRAAPRCSVHRWRYHTSVWTCYQGSRNFYGFFGMHPKVQGWELWMAACILCMYMMLLQVMNYRTVLPGSIFREPKQNFHVGFNIIFSNITTTCG